MHSFFDLIDKRHSVRAYKDKEIEDDKLLKILDATRKAPSAGNLQAYTIYVIRDRTIKKQLVAAALDQEFIAEAPIILIFVAVPERSTWRYGSRGEFYSLQDAIIAAAYAQLAATALDLASVWVGAFDENEVRKIIDTKDKPIAIMPIGYPNEEPEITERRKIEEFVIYK